MKDIKISVIMPLYNSSDFLRESLTCVLLQSLREIEVILVDDGSIDDTCTIIESFKQNDQRIVFLKNEKNMGAAYSRNRGIKIARGKYLIFLDGDDVFLPSLLETLYTCAERNDAQIVLCDYAQVPSEDINSLKSVFHNSNFKNRFYKCFSASELPPCYCHVVRTSLGGYFVRRSLVNDSGIRFQNLRSSNDVFFTFFSFLISSRVVWVDSEIIMWYQRIHNTQSRISYNRDLLDEFKALIKVGNEVIHSDCSVNVFQVYVYRCLLYFVSSVMNEQHLCKKREYYNYLCKKGFRELTKLYHNKGIAVGKIEQEYFALYKRGDYSVDWFPQWYDRVFGVEYHLNKKKADIIQLTKGKRVVIWGAGKNGLIFERFCRNCGIRIKGVIDRDQSKIGKKLNDRTIHDITELNYNDYVVITPMRCDSIVEFCNLNRIRYMCLCDYLDMVE